MGINIDGKCVNSLSQGVVNMKLGLTFKASEMHSHFACGRIWSNLKISGFHRFWKVKISGLDGKRVLHRVALVDGGGMEQDWCFRKGMDIEAATHSSTMWLYAPMWTIDRPNYRIYLCTSILKLYIVIVNSDMRFAAADDQRLALNLKFGREIEVKMQEKGTVATEHICSNSLVIA